MVRVWGPKSHEFVDLFKSAEWCRNGSYVDEKLQLEFNFPLNLEEKIWWANPGVCVFPDFFRRNSPPKGMHGYSMDDPLMSGFMIANGADVAPNLISEGELVRLFDTLVELFYSDRSLGTDRNSFLKP